MFRVFRWQLLQHVQCFEDCAVLSVACHLSCLGQCPHIHTSYLVKCLANIYPCLSFVSDRSWKVFKRILTTLCSRYPYLFKCDTAFASQSPFFSFGSFSVWGHYCTSSKVAGIGQVNYHLLWIMCKFAQLTNLSVRRGLSKIWKCSFLLREKSILLLWLQLPSYIC